MVSGGRLNDAFQAALSANDLSLVIFTCQLVNTTQIFRFKTPYIVLNDIYLFLVIFTCQLVHTTQIFRFKTPSTSHWSYSTASWSTPRRYSGLKRDLSY